MSFRAPGEKSSGVKTSQDCKTGDCVTLSIAHLSTGK